tara:strand:- start:71 stop:205 length:135 start_codon:yes stop_codon:yes gene_type:complete
MRAHIVDFLQEVQELLAVKEASRYQVRFADEALRGRVRVRIGLG